jgi:hypothetical protein
MSNIWLEMDKEVAHWKRLLLKYGRHTMDCDRPRKPECSCGWDHMKSQLDKWVAAERKKRRKVGTSVQNRTAV